MTTTFTGFSYETCFFEILVTHNKKVWFEDYRDDLHI